jgi:hypothetical protein
LARVHLRVQPEDRQHERELVLFASRVALHHAQVGAHEGVRSCHVKSGQATSSQRGVHACITRKLELMKASLDASFETSCSEVTTHMPSMPWRSEWHKFSARHHMRLLYEETLHSSPVSACSTVGATMQKALEHEAYEASELMAIFCAQRVFCGIEM